MTSVTAETTIGKTTANGVDYSKYHDKSEQVAKSVQDSNVAEQNSNSIDIVTEIKVEKQQKSTNDNIKSKSWNKNEAYDTGPEGGYGWLVILGAFFGYFTSFGTETAWGVLQAHFEKDVFSDIPDAQFQLSFAGTIIGIMTAGIGPIFQLLTSRFGLRPVLIVGVLVMVLGLEIAGFTTKIWHLYLTQGLMFGFGTAFLYMAAITVPAQWFNKKRGLGLSIVTSGAGIGGVILPFIMTALINRVGIAWTYRILGFVYLVMNAITCILVKEKYPSNKRVKISDDGEEQPKNKQSFAFKEIYDFSILKDPIFIWWVIASVIATLGTFTPQFFIPSYALYVGLTADDGSVFSAVLAASSFIFRIPIGYVADRIGRINMLIFSSTISAVASLAIWTVAYDYKTIMGFCVLYGGFCATFYSLISPITATVVGIEKFPTALSIVMLANIVSTMGPNIASAIDKSVDAEPYFAYKMYTGVSFGVGAVLFLGLKIKMTGGLFAKI
ncbi:major facilitator superfamily domain-containing protein [Phascolomyces articulosus]|uniref:Major facilitator superfamily domain-containing protein n=1 Tax=Phascolomyces articulosus TaxID=60185 RepID=A0AAD5P968_9FUNG|nr:major facilitator superfamily domain-containing protein [Phascolomyces articulosus]